MPVTSTKIVLDLADGIAAKSGSTATITDVLSQCDLTDVATGLGVARKWATFEPDSWLLDGSYHIMPATDANVGIISDTITNVSGGFAVEPSLRIDFDTDYDLLYGITLKFSEITGDYCNDLNIEFYDSGDVLLDDDNYTPDDYEYFCELPSTPISSVAYVVITFLSTNKAYRHLRLTDILFDTINFSDSEIQKAILTEKIDPTSLTLPSNYIEVGIKSSTKSFSILDSTSLYYLLKAKQPVYVYETIDGTEYFCGKFYLDSWNSLTEKTLEFSAYCIIELTERVDALGYYYNTVTSTHRDALEVLGYLFDDAGFEYTLDSDLDDKNVTGFVNVKSVRSTLQDMLLTIQGYAKSARSTTIDVLPFAMALQVTEPTITLDNTDRSSNTTLELLPAVTAVNLECFRYKDVSADAFDKINATFAAGTHRLFFKAPTPLSLNSISGATDITNANKKWGTYIDISVAVQGNVTINVIPYTNASRYYELENLIAPANSVPNVLLITGVETIFLDDFTTAPASAANIAQTLVDYYSQRYLQKTKVFGRLDIVPGTRVYTDSQGVDLVGTVESMVTDLSNGCVSQLEIRCVTVPSNFDADTLGVGKYNSDDSRFQYSGTWASAASASAYDGDIEYVGTGNSGYVECTFIGNQAIIVYTAQSDRGSIEIRIDGVLVDTLDQYAAVTAYQSEWTSDVFVYGLHTLRIDHVETGGGDVTDFDALEIL